MLSARGIQQYIYIYASIHTYIHICSLNNLNVSDKGIKKLLEDSNFIHSYIDIDIYI